MSFFRKDNFSLKSYLASKGVQTSDVMAAAVAEWDGLYRRKDRLALPASICTEIARMVTMELKSEITGGRRAEFLNESYQRIFPELRRAAELACAKGGMVFKPYVADGKINVGFIQAENFIPLDYDDSGRIYGAAFLDRAVKDGKTYTRIERHYLKEGLYQIYNCAFVSQNGADLGKPVPLSEVEAWRGIAPHAAARNIKKPLFSYFKMPMANSLDDNSPLGVSVFARGIPLMQDAERQYERLLWEFESGERALYVDEAAVRRDSRGNRVIPDKKLYRLLNSGDESLFEDWTPTLRDGSILNGLNEILRRVEFNVGLAYGTISDVRSIDRTAEEIRASKQRSYTQICDIQAELKHALIDLADAMDELCDLYSLCEGDGGFRISFEFDDGVAADRKTEFDEKLRLLELGIMQPWEMRAWYFGEEEKAARKKLKSGEQARDELCGKGGAMAVKAAQ